MSMVLQRKFDLSNFSKVDLSQEINRAADIIKSDIQKHIWDEDRIDGGGSHYPLANSTVIQKARKKGKLSTGTRTARQQLSAGASPEHVLIDTGNLYTNQKIQRASKARQRAEITIGPTRAQIGVWLQEGTEKMPERPFFGISQAAEKKVETMIVGAILREINRL